MRSAIHFDHARRKFVYRMEGPGDPVIETDTLEDMEEFLDSVDLKVQADADANRIKVLLRRVTQCWFLREKRINLS